MGYSSVIAQVSLKESSLKDQINNSSLVVEGKVVSKKSFWDVDHRLIYTANTVEVYKVFKGNTITTIDVITIGGTVGLTALIASNSLKLQKGSVGIFTLYDSNVNSKSISKNKQFKTYGAIQGFYKYDLYTDAAANPFNKKQGIKSVFYNEIMSHTKMDFIEVADFNIESIRSKFNTNNKGPAITITNFSPTTITAGTGAVLTINGSDFGTQGKVSFRNSDDGGATFFDALDSQILTWTPTQITVEVPSIGNIGTAGTGTIRVTDADDNSDISNTTLTVSSAQSNIPFNLGSGDEAFQVQHLDDNGSGGYTWEMQTDFFNDIEHPGAKAAFMRAFDNWRCTTKINWEVSNTPTTTDVIGVDIDMPVDGELDADNEIVIRFDNGSELGNNVLGTCYSWYSGSNCTTGVEWFVADLDIVFDSEASWYFGTGTFDPGEIDFETVALHELGHGHQLSHVIDTNNLMHFELNPNESFNVLDANSIAAAQDIQSRSITSQNCGPVRDEMVNYSGDCGLSVEDNNLASLITLYPNPASNQFYIKNESFVNLEKAVIYDINGRLISDHDFSNNSRTQAINLVGISKGIYFVNIHSDNTVITKKLIIN
ncbi:hypothetical protein GCM10023311_12100 [Flaviramulus aquimarinus]|uniref:Por secretion system C-terminal sorting domain-containing protein n=1 Tax=Flaviramulus aquimarinus TaxID=1170456 RepID=A0ABP9F4G1_9FLAO